MGDNKGTAYFLVSDESIKNLGVGKDCGFYDWLISEGFSRAEIGTGFWTGVSWLYVNINNKTFAPGMPGIKLVEPVGNHTVTVGEFKAIYGIYKKYENKPPLEMCYDEEIEQFKRQLDIDFGEEKSIIGDDLMDALFKDKPKNDEIKLDHYSWAENSVYRFYEKEYVNKEIEDTICMLVKNELFSLDMDSSRRALRLLIKMLHYDDELPSCSEWKSKKEFERKAFGNLVRLLKNSKDANIVQALDFVQNKLREAKLFENKKDVQIYERLKYELTECTLKDFEALKKAVADKKE